MYGEVLKFGAMIVDSLRTYKHPVFVYIPPGRATPIIPHMIRVDEILRNSTSDPILPSIVIQHFTMLKHSLQSSLSIFKLLVCVGVQSYPNFAKHSVFFLSCLVWLGLTGVVLPCLHLPLLLTLSWTYIRTLHRRRVERWCLGRDRPNHQPSEDGGEKVAIPSHPCSTTCTAPYRTFSLWVFLSSLTSSNNHLFCALSLTCYRLSIETDTPHLFLSSMPFSS